ncbi:MAG: haloacid dehalogenase [Chloroflexi bacterium]|nr:haloacid dehalogenase [Chloroflexota bacterium]
MPDLDSIAEGVRANFDSITAAREQALGQARTLTRHCANAIRAIHRDDDKLAAAELKKAKALALGLQKDLADFPQLYSAGYTQDALKEYAEANLVLAMVKDRELPTPTDLGLEPATYMKGLAEVVGELRRRCLDILRSGHSDEAERLLGHMDEIYTALVTMDYPDAVTGGLRRLTDISRSLVERTRGDVTLSLRQERLESALRQAEQNFSDAANGE